MSRRSLRLDDGLLDRSLPHCSASFSVGGSSWRSSRSLKSRRSQQLSVSCSESLLGQTPRKAAGPSLLNSSLHSVASDASLLSSLLDESSVQETTLVNTFWGLDQDVDPKAGFGHCGDMNLKEWKQRERHPDGSLCDDCKEKRRGSETDNVSSSSSSWWSSSSVASCLLGLTWSATVFTGKTAGEVFRRLSRRWRHMTTSFLLTRFPLRLFLVLLPLLLLFSLCWFGPAGLQSVLPAVNITDWRTAVSDIPALSSIYSIMSSQSQSAGGAMEESREVQTHVGPLYSRTPPAETPTGEEEESAAADDDSVRLVLLEQSLTALWERVEAGGQRAEQRHREVLRMYTDLQQQQQQQLVSVQSSVGEGTEPWLSGLLDQQLSQLRRRLDEERRQREQIRQQDLVQQQSQTSRLDQLELQLQTLAAKTEQVHRRQEAATTVSPSPSTLPAAVSVGVDRQSHDALLAEVARLEAALEDVRRDVEGLSGCRDGCRGLDRIQQTISAQVSSRVRKDVRALIYGNQLTVGGGASGDTAALPESLLQWLSQQYVSGADLQAALASLELSILQNISLQLQQQHRSEEMVSEAVLHAAGAAGAAVTQEEVHMIVKNALRLFSQDRTGLADYALESGGGSVLSTRCSETYETKAALLSLFGVPLWYFSQSPRAVIQPDVHPGNCWAFRGSTGFLVIRLSMKILPTAFSLEHIPKSLAPSGTLHSAPRDFNVYGLDEESQERGKLLGTYTYDEDGEALQTYSVTEENDQTFQIIEVQVLSNWGHQEYTCMYRFRVHGTPQS
ncbi:SUN domain-containing protein 1-like isoform X7 [Thunnus maccoyii]|uniref:SUN domain-containing protein 1-like isoform X7 n=1 Tax=Thunnus maccoyii TaxID=8240 RepID=UPI001C4CE44C|nr:SUN domain-containing protein 1-like isoform X7 [Thunnus maccoyii]